MKTGEEITSIDVFMKIIRKYSKITAPSIMPVRLSVASLVTGNSYRGMLGKLVDTAFPMFCIQSVALSMTFLGLHSLT